MKPLPLLAGDADIGRRCDDAGAGRGSSSSWKFGQVDTGGGGQSVWRVNWVWAVTSTSSTRNCYVDGT